MRIFKLNKYFVASFHSDLNKRKQELIGDYGIEIDGKKYYGALNSKDLEKYGRKNTNRT